MRNIIITGGGMVNKGAQAMTMIAVDELRKRFPEHQILLYDQENRQDSGYTFGYIGWYPVKFAKAQKNPFLRAVCLLRSRRELLECEAFYKNTDLLVDISGYALGSNWSAKICGDYLDPLEFARDFGIPVYLMPQSFGPFDFLDPEIDRRCRKLLPTAKIICAREREGYDALKNSYGLENVICAPDLVLNNKGIDLDGIYQNVPEIDLPALAEKSVGIIPNQRNFDVGNRESVFSFYCTIMEHILAAGNTVYILSHSAVDSSVCKALKELYVEEDRVVLLDQEFSCVEFNALVGGFRYLVASRFHSIVHAYKNGTPCIALGWATKYHDLLAQFGQSDYIFDVRKGNAAEEVAQVLEQMERRAAEESKTILAALEPLQAKNVFDILKIEPQVIAYAN